jgi:hypothetical protein
MKIWEIDMTKQQKYNRILFLGTAWVYGYCKLDFNFAVIATMTCLALLLIDNLNWGD